MTPNTEPQAQEITDEDLENVSGGTFIVTEENAQQFIDYMTAVYGPKG